MPGTENNINTKQQFLGPWMYQVQWVVFYIQDFIWSIQLLHASNAIRAISYEETEA